MTRSKCGLMPHPSPLPQGEGEKTGQLARFLLTVFLDLLDDVGG
jgi:hypothetical protein